MTGKVEEMDGGNRAEPYEGQWGYAGSCDPLAGGQYPGMETFTLGCFQWIRRGSGKGLKRGPVQKRIKGHVSDPHDAHRRASAFCEERNSQLARLPASGKHEE